MSESLESSPQPVYPCFIRVDASETIGTGHVMRCLALAAALKAKTFDVTFLLALCPQPLVERLQAAGHKVQFLPGEIIAGSADDAKYTAAQALEYKSKWLILDGYHFLSDYQATVKNNQIKLAYIDDLHHCQTYPADLVINQNPSANAEQYPNIGPDTELLLGPAMTLIREEFIEHRKKTDLHPQPVQAKKILVTMGGADIDNVTAKVMRGLSLLQGFDVTVLIGGGNSHGQSLLDLAEKLNALADAQTKFACLQNASNMPELIDHSDLLISAGGTTVWEAAYLCTPTAVIITADNQVDGMENFAARDAVALLGRQENLTAEEIAFAVGGLAEDQVKRKSLALQAAVIDGAGAARVATKIYYKIHLGI